MAGLSQESGRPEQVHSCQDTCGAPAKVPEGQCRYTMVPLPRYLTFNYGAKMGVVFSFILSLFTQ